MLFPTFKFFVFFCIVFSVFWSLPTVINWLPWGGKLKPHRLRMLWLLLASCFFYMSWNPYLILLILFSASVDYIVALKLQHVVTLWKRRALLILSICTNLCLLFFFKYTHLLLGSFQWCVNSLGFDMPPLALPSKDGSAMSFQLNLFDFGPNPTFTDIILPLGISFYTFETISYIVDVYLGKIKPVRNLLDYALYIMFFPHLVAGPIVRPRDFLPQLQQTKRFNWDRMQLGLQFFLVGLFKKAVIADNLAKVVDPVFNLRDANWDYGSSAVWLAVICYAVQIYCDFSGYSDMAVGLAHTLGFKLPMNFNMPYFASNITEFWRRWHISLSTWLRDYLYIPLGGNRSGKFGTYRNLFLTMLLGGLWHGASWTFVVWGAFHGILLALHRIVALPRWLGHVVFRPFFVAATFLAVCLGWVFFRAQTFSEAATLLNRMFWPTTGKVLSPMMVSMAVTLLIIVFLAHLVGTFVNVKKVERWLPAPILGAAMAVLLLLAQLLMPEDGQAFIYFQF